MRIEFSVVGDICGGGGKGEGSGLCEKSGAVIW